VQKLLFWFSLSVSTFCILLIPIDVFRKLRIKEKPAIIALRDFNFELMQSICCFMGTAIVFSNFLKWYFKAYSILIPDHLSKWYQMFDYNALIAIRDLFFKNFKLVELYTMDTYMGLGFWSLSLSIMLLGVGIFQLYIGLKRRSISAEGVYCPNNRLKWTSIVEYEWQSAIEKNKIKQSSEYYNLSLYVEKDKFTRWLFYNDDLRKYTLKISSQDKEKVDCLINNNNIKLRTSGENVEL
jgi:hypothetical protein